MAVRGVMAASAYGYYAGKSDKEKIAILRGEIQLIKERIKEAKTKGKAAIYWKGGWYKVGTKWCACVGVAANLLAKKENELAGLAPVATPKFELSSPDIGASGWDASFDPGFSVPEVPDLMSAAMTAPQENTRNAGAKILLPLAIGGTLIAATLAILYGNRSGS